MESSRDLPSINSIDVNNMIWPQEQTQQVTQEKEANPYEIYTVSKCIRNPFILAHIKPDYGSLGEFIGDVSITKDLLTHKKKRNQQQDDAEQKKIRNLLKQKNLQKVLRTGNANSFQKVVASKMIIEELFQKNFGVSVNSFYAQNTKQQSNKGRTINFETLEDMLNQIIVKPKDQFIRNPGKLRSMIYDNEVQKNPLLSTKQIAINNVKQKIKILNEIRKKYRAFIKHQIKIQESQIEEMDHIQENCLQSTFSNFKSMENTSLKQFIIENEKKSLLFQHLIDRIQKAIIEKVQIIKIISVKISDDLLCYLLDVFIKMGHSLNEVYIENVSFQNSQKISLKIKQIIEETKMEKIALNNVKLRTKDFCLICLGIGTKKHFSHLQLKNNEIDDIGIKCLDVIIKFFKEIKIDLSGNPIQKELKGKTFYHKVTIS